jgi:large subunit ribosomal protein L4e
VSVQPVGEAKGAKQSVTTPNVLLSPIRPDIVQFVHTSMAKNSRQPYAVAENAGHQHSAESWGTGRAVARIPRVSGGGNGRSGQAAFGNQCRKGRMYAPTKIWRKWHRKINLNQKRFAVASALAASALPSLVLARGHRIEQVPELPLVVDDAVQSIQKTKAAVAALKAVGAYADVEKAGDSRKIRRGVGKMRNRRHVMRRGPLIVYNEDHGIQQAFRNLPGVELCQVDNLNLLQLAPGGHLGRFIVWTRGAFTKLNSLWGSVNHEAAEKSGYTLPRPIMSNPDVTRLINSDEIQSKVRPSIKTVHRFTQHKNPLTNLGVRVRLNPYALSLRRSQLLSEQRRKNGKKTAMEAKRDQAMAAANRTHEPQQRQNYLRIASDEFKAPEKALKLKISKPRPAQQPPKPLTDAQRKAKVEARKKKPKKASEKKKYDEAAEKAEERKRKEAPKQIPKQLLAIATAKVTKIKKASTGGKKGKAAGKKEDGKKEEGKKGAEAGKAEAGKKGAETGKKAEAGKKEEAKKGAEAGKKEAGKKGK